MNGVRDDLVVELDGINLRRLLRRWRWLIDRSLAPLFATAFGDLFLRGADSRLWRLDVGTGQLTAVARDPEHFERLLEDGEQTDYWFGGVLVDALRGVGVRLKRGECYSYKLPPVLGGSFEPDNFRIYDLQTHFDVWGPIHERLKDIPDGAEVEFRIDDEEET